VPSRRQRPLAHHVSTELLPPPPSVPPSTRLVYATARLRDDISSSEPESSDSPSPASCHAAAHLIHSPQLTNSQLPQILTQDVISTLICMPPCRTGSVVSSHCRYKGDIKSSDDLHEACLLNERPLMLASRTRQHELGDVMPRPPLRVFASSEKVLPNPAALLPTHHSAPSVLPNAASSVPAPSGHTPNAVVTVPDPSPTHSSPRRLSCAPCTGAVPP